MVEVILLPTEDPQLRLSVEETDLDPAVEIVEVIRRIDGEPDTTVRSLLGLHAAGGFSDIDWEPPLGEFEYVIRQLAADGTPLPDVEPIPASTPPGNPNFGWISDPLNPAAAIRVRLLHGAGADQSAPVHGTRHLVSQRVVALAGAQDLLTGLEMPFITEGAEDRGRMSALLKDAGGLILVRTAPPHALPRLLYATAWDARPTSYSSDDLTVWACTLDQISEIEGPPVASPVTWGVYEAAFATWGELEAAYASWLEMYKNPPAAQ